MVIRESDWKLFKKYRDEALERLCKAILEEARALSGRTDLSHRERYLAVYECIHRGDRKIRSAFDGLSRSRAALQLEVMASLQLLSDAEIDQFSPDFRPRLSWTRSE